MITITKEDALIISRIADGALRLCGDKLNKEYGPSVQRLRLAIANEKDDLSEAMETLRKVNLAIESGGRLKTC